MEVQQFATRHVVLGIHQVEITVHWMHDDAIGHTHLLQFLRIGKTGANQLMATHIDNAIRARILLGLLVITNAIEIEGIAYDAEVGNLCIHATI